jgi:NAD(P)-dependent dehydrogenase (short-subunit alcohol dehydrogenase family)
MTISSTSVFRDGLLEGKSAFVTGGTSGINLAIATRLVRAGAKVTVLGRKEDKAQAAAQSLAGLGPPVLAVTADVRDYAAVEQALKRAVTAHGPIDVLVCGAAGNFPAPAMAMSANGFKAVIDIDLLGSFNTCRAAFALLAKGASVIAISAGQATAPALMQAHVCAAKAGVEMLIRVLAMEWGGAGVRVNAITPGPIDGTEGMARLASTPEARAKIVQSVPLGRLGHGEDIAEMALFLSTEAAAYVTGAVFVVDGGFGLGGFGMQAMG